MAENIKNKNVGERHPVDAENEKDQSTRPGQEAIENREQPVNGLDAPPGAAGGSKLPKDNPAENSPPLYPPDNPGLNIDPKRIGNIPAIDNRPVYSSRRKELMDDKEEKEIVNRPTEYPQDDIDREDIDREENKERYFLNSDIDKSFMSSRFYPDRSSFRNHPPFHRR